MKATDWLTSDDVTGMWGRLPRPSRRVAALFAVACVRRTPRAEEHSLLPDTANVAEQAADTGNWGALGPLGERAGQHCHAVELESPAHFWALAALRLTGENIDYYAVHVPFFMDKALAGESDAVDLRRCYADLLRDVAGKPGRNGRGKVMKHPTRAYSFPVLRTAHLTPTVLSLAAGIYEEKAFDRLPILADALANTGCSNDQLLGHLRRPGPHVRGCWGLDLILGKS